MGRVFVARQHSTGKRRAWDRSSRTSVERLSSEGMGSLRNGLLCLALSAVACDSPHIVALSCGDRRVDDPEVCDEGEQNGTPGHCRADCSGIPELVSIEGDVLLFGAVLASQRLAGAKVSISELPETLTTTDADGHFHFEDVEAGTFVTLVVEDETLIPSQSPKIRVGDDGVNPFVLYAMPKERIAAWEIDPGGCTVVVAASRLGDNPYTSFRLHVPEAKIALEPAMNAVPEYFDSAGALDPALETTSESGMALFRDLRSGEYQVVATDGSRRFSKVTIQCQPGVVVLADSPSARSRTYPCQTTPWIGPRMHTQTPRTPCAKEPPSASTPTRTLRWHLARPLTTTSGPRYPPTATPITPCGTPSRPWLTVGLRPARVRSRRMRRAPTSWPRSVPHYRAMAAVSVECRNPTS